MAGPFDEDESVRLVLPCRDREVSSISGGVMFDWGLLPPLVLFLFVNRLPGNVVIIVAEASICSFGGGRVGGWGAALVLNPFSQVLMGGRGVEGVDVRRGGSSVKPSVSFTQECWCARQPGCLCLYRLMVQTQLASIGSWALE